MSEDHSALVRAAIDLLTSQLERQRLQESAALYAEVHEQDEESREWLEVDVPEWPK